MKDTVLISMSVLALMVALNNEWLAFFKAWVTASVGGPGFSTLTDAGKAAGNPNLSDVNSQSLLQPSPQAQAAGATSNLITRTS